VTDTSFRRNSVVFLSVSLVKVEETISDNVLLLREHCDRCTDIAVLL